MFLLIEKSNLKASLVSSYSIALFRRDQRTVITMKKAIFIFIVVLLVVKSLHGIPEDQERQISKWLVLVIRGW